MAEPGSKSKFKIIWMAEPGHPHEVGVLHNRYPAAGTRKPLRKRSKFKCNATEDYLKIDINAGGLSLADLTNTRFRCAGFPLFQCVFYLM